MLLYTADVLDTLSLHNSYVLFSKQGDAEQSLLSSSQQDTLALCGQEHSETGLG